MLVLVLPLSSSRSRGRDGVLAVACPCLSIEQREVLFPLSGLSLPSNTSLGDGFCTDHSSRPL